MLFRRNRNCQGGGVAIYCKQTLNPRLIDDLKVASIKEVAIKIQYHRNSPMIVCCIYFPPKMNADWTNAFYTYLSQLTILSPKVLLLGDFNSDLLVPSDFSDEIMRSFDLQQIVKMLTRITESTVTLLDHTYVLKNLPVCAGTINLHIADHYAIYCCILTSEYCINTNYQHLVVQHRSFKKVNTTLLVTDLMSLASTFTIEPIHVSTAAANFINRFCDTWNHRSSRTDNDSVDPLG